MRNWQEDMELCEKATSGEWFQDNDVLINVMAWIPNGEDADLDLIAKTNYPTDAQFIAEARKALPYWLNAYRELEAQYATMRETLEATEKIFFQITECENKGNGHCRYCQVEEYPVDEHGQRIYTQNVEHAVEWHFDHEEWCPSRIIDENRKDLSSTAGEALLDRLQKAEAVVEVAKDTCEELWGHGFYAIATLQKALDDLEGVTGDSE